MLMQVAVYRLSPTSSDIAVLLGGVGKEVNGLQSYYNIGEQVAKAFDNFRQHGLGELEVRIRFTELEK